MYVDLETSLGEDLIKAHFDRVFRLVVLDCSFHLLDASKQN
jgi:hypothetical protein